MLSGSNVMFLGENSCYFQLKWPTQDFNVQNACYVSNFFLQWRGRQASGCFVPGQICILFFLIHKTFFLIFIIRKKTGRRDKDDGASSKMRRRAHDRGPRARLQTLFVIAGARQTRHATVQGAGRRGARADATDGRGSPAADACGGDPDVVRESASRGFRSTVAPFRTRAFPSALTAFGESWHF